MPEFLPDSMFDDGSQVPSTAPQRTATPTAPPVRTRSEAEEQIAATSLPRNLDAEESVIGSILLHNEAMDEVALLITADDFWHPGCAAIYRVASMLRRDGKVADAVTVSHVLEGEKLLETVGGVRYLLHCLESVPHALHGKYYAGIVRDCSMRREVILAADEAREMAHDFSQSPEETIGKADNKMMRILEKGRSESLSLQDIFIETMDAMNRRWKAGDSWGGVSLGFKELDDLFQGIPDDSLLVLAARPSMGKTQLMLNIAANFAARGDAVDIHSLEMNRVSLAERMVISQAKLDSGNVKKNNLSDAERHHLMETFATMDKWPLFVDDAPVQSIASIMARARVLKRKANLKAVMVDYLQLIQPFDRREKREQQVAGIARSLKQLARDLQVPVIAIAQMNRGVETRNDKRPRLTDLRESGSIEQDADQVMFVHRPEYYEAPLHGAPTVDERNAYNERARPGEAEIILAKNRHGPVGSTWMNFRTWCGRFETKRTDVENMNYEDFPDP